MVSSRFFKFLRLFSSIITFLFLCTGIFSLFFTSCSMENGASENNVNQNTEKDGEGQLSEVGSLLVNAENFSETQPSSKIRTLKPENVDFEKDGNFTFVLSGMWKSEGTSSARTVEIASWTTDDGWTYEANGSGSGGASGSAAKKSAWQKMQEDTSLQVQTGLWDFYLVAKNSSGYMSGYSVFTKTLSDITIKRGTNTLSFGTMEEADKPGWVSITLNFPSTLAGEVTRVEVKLEDYNDTGSSSAITNSLEIKSYGSSDAAVLEGKVNEGDRYVTFTKSPLACGTYRIFFYLYDHNGFVVKTARDVLWVSSGRQTKSSLKISSLNTLYKIEYAGIDDSYNCVSGYTSSGELLNYFNESQTVTLPSEEFVKGPYFLGGWYLNEDFTGESIQGWLPGESPREEGAAEASDVTLWPKWYTLGSTCADAISRLTASGSSTVNYTIRVKGQITSDNFRAIKTALQRIASNANLTVSLDLSETSFTVLPESAFTDCQKIKGVILPPALTGIGTRAFSGCSQLESISIPGTVTTIENFAFNRCDALTEVRLEDGSNSLKVGYNGSRRGLFYDCPLAKIYIGRNLTYSGNNGKNEDSASNGYAAFAYYGSRTEATTCRVEIGPKVTSIQPYSFYKRFEITSVTISETANITYIEEYAFLGCSSLTNFNIPSTVKSIDVAAFNGCSALESISIPAVTTIIGNGAFNDCSKLKNVRLEDGSTSLNVGYNESQQGLFYDCPLTSIYIGRNLTYSGNNGKNVDSASNGYAAFAYYGSRTEATTCRVEIGPKVTSIQPHSFYKRFEITSVSISETANITSIGENAFSGCSSLTSFNIPSTVKNIGEYAFKGCSALESITIPAVTTAIDIGAFNGCSNLKNVRLEDGSANLQLGYNASSKGLFYDCPLTSIYIGRNITYSWNGGNNVDSYNYGYAAFARWYGDADTTTCTVEIGSKVTSIQPYSFYKRSGITSITVPSSVTSIGEKAFYGCSGLKKLIFEDGTSTLSLLYNVSNSKGIFSDIASLEELYLGRKLSITTHPFRGVAETFAITSKLTIGAGCSEIPVNTFLDAKVSSDCTMAVEGSGDWYYTQSVTTVPGTYTTKVEADFTDSDSLKRAFLNPDSNGKTDSTLVGNRFFRYIQSGN